MCLVGIRTRECLTSVENRFVLISVIARWLIWLLEKVCMLVWGAWVLYFSLLVRSDAEDTEMMRFEVWAGRHRLICLSSCLPKPHMFVTFMSIRYVDAWLRAVWPCLIDVELTELCFHLQRAVSAQDAWKLDPATSSVHCWCLNVHFSGEQ